MSNPSELLPPGWVGPLVLVFGLMIGSFLNVVIHRLPAGVSIVFPGSRCPQCESPIRAWQNVPVLSWLWLQGRCAGCRAPISWRYPATELATGLLYWGVWHTFGLSWQAAALWLFVSLSVVVFWIDWDTMLIFDQVTVPGIGLGLCYSHFLAGQGLSALAAALFGVAFLLAVNSLTLLAIGEDGVGDGDLTLVAMLGAWLGLQGALVAVALSLIFGSLMGMGILYARWLKAGVWLPVGLATVTSPLFFLAVGLATGAPLGEPRWWLGAHLAPLSWGATVLVSVFLGASIGWVAQRVLQDEGRLVMPFGPALVMGGLVALFVGDPAWQLLSEQLVGP